jgi:hypothetical protein
MNLLHLKWSSWIIILNIVLLSALIYNTIKKERVFDFFGNYAQQVDVTNVTKSDPDTNAANENYAQLMYFIQNHPDKSFKFIQDIQNKFFLPSCSVKPNINFNGLMKSGGGMIFS